jgi:4,5-dihydroxyphthalate decarboxylase
VQGGEQSMMIHLSRIDKRDRSHVGLPIFPLRNFTARDIYVRKGGGISKPADLAGKRIGMYGWGNSGSVWYRHFFRYLGLDLTKLQWCIGPVDAPMATTATTVLPPGVTAPPAGKSLAQMLIAGELDAIYSPPKPKDYNAVGGPIVRLFPDYKGIEQEYFRKTGAFPPQHLVLVRRAVWEQNKWIARSLTDAFIACEDMFTACLRGFPYSTPWQETELADTDALMGEDFHPYGYEKNRAQIEMFCNQAHEVGLTARRVTPEEYFEEFLAS